MKKAELNLIVCLGKNNLLGDADPTGNGLLWHSKEELQYYKSKTIGNVVIFGYTTSKVVPIELMKKNRTVEILRSAMDPSDIINKYEYSGKDIFVCGGYKIYKLFLEKYKLDNIYISRLKDHISISKPNTPLFFPDVEQYGYKLLSSIEHEDFFAETYKK